MKTGKIKMKKTILSTLLIATSLMVIAHASERINVTKEDKLRGVEWLKKITPETSLITCDFIQKSTFVVREKDIGVNLAGSIIQGKALFSLPFRPCFDEQKEYYFDTFRFGFVTNGEVAYLLTSRNKSFEKKRKARALDVYNSVDGSSELVKYWSENQEIDFVTIMPFRPRLKDVEVRRSFNWDRR
jgi:hypothetical protein